MTNPKPTPDEYGEFYAGYINLIDETDLIDHLAESCDALHDLIANCDPETLTTPHAEGEWTIQQVLSHIIDTERVFAYRLLRIVRGDQTPLPGFDQDEFMATSHANQTPFNVLWNDYSRVRQATISLLRTIQSDEQWQSVGQASGSPLSTRAAAYIIAGHQRHHYLSLQENYFGGDKFNT